MANSKISALTSATTPLTGTETLPIVQGGATVKTTVADITNGGGYAGAFTTLSATGVTTVQAGTALLPAITTSGDTNTGIWFPAADTIAFTDGGVESMRITSAGRVGIGTSAPGAKLELSDATIPVYLQQTRGSVVQLAGPVGSAVTSPGQIGTTSNSPFRIITNNTARLTIDETGNVGVGTTTPSGLLHLSGNTAATTAPAIVLQDSGTTATRLGTLTNDGGDLVLAMTASLTDLRSAVTLFDDRKITFTTNTTEKMRITSVGGVSIGTITDAGAGNLLMGTGNVTQGTAAKGFDFSANTPLAGKTSTILNWYEEGTWTPNQGAGLTLVGAFSSTGRYTRIGRQVSISGTVTGATSVAVTAAGVITSNLPFTVVTAGHGGATNVANNASATVICTSTSVTAAVAITATTTITFSATYFV